jgi:hypothetical protein
MQTRFLGSSADLAAEGRFERNCGAHIMVQPFSVERRSPAIRVASRSALVALTVALSLNLALSGCQSNPSTQGTVTSVEPVGGTGVGPQDANKLLVVDCLLPGQVRKLGGTTYLTPRRPIRTVASECEIRGGEYTSYDRADFRTARLVWLPKAQEGDAEAQVYLGEIYEKGLGVAPDYAVAAAWYRRAALQGNSRGAINLGYLYEKGLGVPKDLTQALNWYRKASGLSGDELQFASNIEATERKLGELEQQLSYSRQEAAELRRRLGRYEREIDKRQKALQRSEQEVETLRRRMDSAPPAASTSTDEVERLRRELDQQRHAVQQQRAESQRLQQELERKTGRLLAELEESRADQVALQDSVQVRERELARLRSELDAAHQARESSRSALQEQRSLLEASRRAVAEIRERLQAAQRRRTAADARTGDAVADLQQQLRAREQELERYRGRVGELETDLARKQSEIETAQALQARLESRVAAGDAAQGDLRRQLKDARRTLSETTARLRTQDARVLEAERELERLLNGMQEREQDASQSAAELADLNRQLERQRTLLQQARQEQARLQGAMAQQQAALGAEIRALREREQQLDKALARSAEQSEESNRKLATANDRLRESEQRLAALRTELIQQREQAAQAATRHAGESARSQAAIGGLEEELKEKEAALAQQREALSRLKTEAEESRRAFESVRREQLKLVSAPPSIEILDPPITLTRSGELTVQLRSVTRERTVVGKVTAPAGLLSLTVNDRRQQPDRDGIFQSNIPVAEQKTPVSVVAVDKKGQKASIDFSLVAKLRLAEARPAIPPAKAPALPDINFGNYYALIIGNNNYQHFPKLQSAANDARALDRVLRERYGFRTTLLIDANRYQILSALNGLRERLTERDNLLVFYAGHGELDRVNRRGHWLPVDAEPNNSANWISNIAVTDILNVVKAKHVLVVADSCYSGALTRSSMARIAPATRDNIRVKWLKVMNRTRSRTVLTSGGLKPVLDTGGGGHSVFANVFLRILEKNDGILDGYKLYRSLFDDVRRAAARFDVDQEPLYAPIKYAGHEAGEFFFVPKRASLQGAAPAGATWYSAVWSKGSRRDNASGAQPLSAAGLPEPASRGREPRAASSEQQWGRAFRSVEALPSRSGRINALGAPVPVMHGVARSPGRFRAV